jgi:hypothetical protein
VFVYRSFYGMRIETGAAKAEAEARVKPA